MSFLSELLSIPFIHTERGENLGGRSSHLMGAGPTARKAFPMNSGMLFREKGLSACEVASRGARAYKSNG